MDLGPRGPAFSPALHTLSLPKNDLIWSLKWSVTTHCFKMLPT